MSVCTVYNVYIVCIIYIYIYTYVFTLVPWHSHWPTAEVMKLPSEARVLTVFLGPWRRIRLTNFSIFEEKSG